MVIILTDNKQELIMKRIVTPKTTVKLRAKVKIK
jgi:hypothetical protein